MESFFHGLAGFFSCLFLQKSEHLPAVCLVKSSPVTHSAYTGIWIQPGKRMILSTFSKAPELCAEEEVPVQAMCQITKTIPTFIF